jgi:hypothetical protein
MGEERLTPDEQADARQLFQQPERVCGYCGGIHMRACPRVREIEFYDSGKLKRMTFWREDEWNDSFIVWPEMAYDGDGEGEAGTEEKEHE